MALSRGKLRHIEVEHKYVVPKTFDLKRLRLQLKKMKPNRSFDINVRDDYYWSEAFPKAILRHRFDSELQQLTLKSQGLAADARVEVNLQLDHGQGDQRDGVRNFLGKLSAVGPVTVQKKVAIFLFNDCEVCFYEATCGSRKIRCVEFEALSKSTLKVARNVIEGYEQRTGFATMTRESRSLFELLVAPELKRRKQQRKKQSK